MEFEEIFFLFDGICLSRYWIRCMVLVDICAIRNMICVIAFPKSNGLQLNGQHIPYIGNCRYWLVVLITHTLFDKPFLFEAMKSGSWFLLALGAGELVITWNLVINIQDRLDIGFWSNRICLWVFKNIVTMYLIMSTLFFPFSFCAGNRVLHMICFFGK